MRQFATLSLLTSVISLLKLSNAQNFGAPSAALSAALSAAPPTGPQDLFTVPGCSTADAIINSCAHKLGTAVANTASAFSCICYDNSGNYVPSSYDDAASSCSSYAVTAFTTQGNALEAYIAGFCTDTLYAPPGTTVVTTASVAAGTGDSMITQAMVS
jgi:hypothetical protein